MRWQTQTVFNGRSTSFTRSWRFCKLRVRLSDRFLLTPSRALQHLCQRDWHHRLHQLLKSRQPSQPSCLLMMLTTSKTRCQLHAASLSTQQRNHQRLLLHWHRSSRRSHQLSLLKLNDDVQNFASDTAASTDRLPATRTKRTIRANRYRHISWNKARCLLTPQHYTVCASHKMERGANTPQHILWYQH